MEKRSTDRNRIGKYICLCNAEWVGIMSCTVQSLFGCVPPPLHHSTLPPINNMPTDKKGSAGVLADVPAHDYAVKELESYKAVKL